MFGGPLVSLMTAPWAAQDTAHNFIEYIEVIRHCLRVRGTSSLQQTAHALVALITSAPCLPPRPDK